MVVAFADDRLIGRLVRFAWDPLGYVGVSDSCNRRVIGSIFDGLTKKSSSIGCDVNELSSIK